MGKSTEHAYPTKTSPQRTNGGRTRYIENHYYYEERPHRCGILCCIICGTLAFLFFIAWLVEREASLLNPKQNNTPKIAASIPPAQPTTNTRSVSFNANLRLIPEAHHYSSEYPAYNGGRMKMEARGSEEFVNEVKKEMDRAIERSDALMRERAAAQPAVVIAPACSSSCSCRRYCMRRPVNCLPTYVNGTAYYCNTVLPYGRLHWCDCQAHIQRCATANLDWRTTYCTCNNACCGR